jgi:NADH-quinone oxidoreductase subunit C
MSQTGAPASAPNPPTAAPPRPPAAAPAPPKPEPIRAKDLASKITGKFPDVKVDWMKERRLKVTSDSSRIKDVALFVRDQLGFDHISAVSGVDWIAKNELEVIYFVGSVRAGWADFVVAVAERIPRDNPVVSSLIEVWSGADFSERETHEMFGINFRGHPSTAHLFLPEDWNDLPPLRKDYVSPGR